MGPAVMGGGGGGGGGGATGLAKQAGISTGTAWLVSIISYIASCRTRDPIQYTIAD